MLPRPRFRLPLWAAFAIAIGVYAVRSIARGFDFALDQPADSVAIVAFLAVTALVAWTRARDGSDAQSASSYGRDDAPDLHPADDEERSDPTT